MPSASPRAQQRRVPVAQEPVSPVERGLVRGLRLIQLHDRRRQVGVGFQILNDLNDWAGDNNNKLVAGQDALSLRPTVLLALALQAATAEQKQEIREILESRGEDAVRLARLRRIFSATGAFKAAEQLVEKSRTRAEAMADSVESEPLRKLLYFFIDTVLAEDPHVSPVPPEDEMLVQLPILAPA